MMNADDTPTQDQGNRRADPHAHEARNTVPYGEVLRAVVRYLRAQPLLLFPLGAMTLLAAASVRGAETVRALTTPVLALAVLGILAWLYSEFRRAPERAIAYLSDDFRIEIRKPRDRSKFSQSDIDVEGSFRVQPPHGTLRIFTTDGSRFWPQRIPSLHPDKTWSVKVGIGDVPSDLAVVAAIVGPSTRLLLDYYRKVRDLQKTMLPEFQKSIPLDALPADAVQQCSVNVTRL